MGQTCFKGKGPTNNTSSITAAVNSQRSHSKFCWLSQGKSHCTWSTIPAGWVDVTEHTDGAKEIVFCKFSSKQSLVRVSYSVHITEDFQWRLICRGRSVPHPEACPLLRSVPSALKSVTDVVQILTLLNTSTVCEGNTDERFHCLSNSRKGHFMDPTGTYVYMHV